MELLTTFFTSPRKISLQILALFSITVGFISGCGGGGSSDTKKETKNIETVETIEQQIHNALNTVETDADFSFLIESHSGTQLVHHRGNSTITTSYRSASTSKMVTSSVILRLVQQGVLSLDDHPQDYLNFWPTIGNKAAIKLRHLLNFTSGLTEEPLCLNLPNANFHNCVEAIVNENPTVTTPGDRYFYASSHLQVAGLMAIEASGLDNWAQVFDNYKLETQLFPNATYDLPSVNNPRLAGGMHWQALEYLAFLSALYHQQLLFPDIINMMVSDQIANTPIAYSPVAQWPITTQWHYGFGLWIECASVPFDCTTTTRVSSAGTYGAYPFIDYEHKYFGIVAREGSLGTGFKGYQVWSEVKSELEHWAKDNR